MSDKDIEVLKRDVQQILFYLHNDSGTGEKGLVAAFHEHEKEFKSFKAQYELEQQVKRAKMGVWGAVGGAILTAIVFGVKTFWAFLLENIHK